MREVFPDGSLGPIQKRPKPPRHQPNGAPPAATISKYEGCSKDELLQKVKDIRAQKELLEKKKNPVPGQPGIKLPKEEWLELQAHVRELEQLHHALQRVDPGVTRECAPVKEASDDCADDDVAAGGGAAVEFSSSDGDA